MGEGVHSLSISILIVEDEIILAMDMKSFLEEQGFKVQAIAFSGHDALMQAEQNRPDLVLVDIKLEGYMDGIEAAKYIMEKFAIPVVFVTGNTDQPTKDRALAIKPAGYLKKPVNEENLYAVIREVLRSRKGAA
jgi:DNA-binding NarL/FixJ family response regulator